MLAAGGRPQAALLAAGSVLGGSLVAVQPRHARGGGVLRSELYSSSMSAT